MSLPKSIPLMQTADRNVNQLQHNILPIIKQILSVPLLSGELLQNISLISGQTTVNHGLGRKIQGWIAVRVRAETNLWDSQDGNPNATKTLLLNSSNAASVDLWVF